MTAGVIFGIFKGICLLISSIIAGPAIWRHLTPVKVADINGDELTQEPEPDEGGEDPEG